MVRYSAPGGLSDAVECADVVEGSQVELDAECGHWVRLKASEPAAWLELDCFLAG